MTFLSKISNKKSNSPMVGRLLFVFFVIPMGFEPMALSLEG